jgi:hypothetical protein
MLKGEKIFQSVQESFYKCFDNKLSNLRMMELGNQGMQINGINYKVAKDYFQSLGIQHTSIDLNGRHGAMKFDLGIPLKEFYCQYDIVTNFGTSEHVYNQYECFKNIHEFCKGGGLMIHAVPMPGHWPRHCEYHYPKKFFVMLADACGYNIYALGVESMPGGPPRMKNKRNIVYAILRKEDLFDFIDIDEFEKFPIIVESYKKNSNNKRPL